MFWKVSFKKLSKTFLFASYPLNVVSALLLHMFLQILLCFEGSSQKSVICDLKVVPVFVICLKFLYLFLSEQNGECAQKIRARRRDNWWNNWWTTRKLDLVIIWDTNNAAKSVSIILEDIFYKNSVTPLLRTLIFRSLAILWKIPLFH